MTKLALVKPTPAGLNLWEIAEVMAVLLWDNPVATDHDLAYYATDMLGVTADSKPSPQAWAEAISEAVALLRDQDRPSDRFAAAAAVGQSLGLCQELDYTDNGVSICGARGPWPANAHGERFCTEHA